MAKDRFARALAEGWLQLLLTRQSAASYDAKVSLTCSSPLPYSIEPEIRFRSNCHLMSAEDRRAMRSEWFRLARRILSRGTPAARFEIAAKRILNIRLSRISK
jgi:hypothetical protein